MSNKINWLKDTDGKYKKSLRGHTAEITINPVTGKASLVIDNGSPTVYDTRRLAKIAFENFLSDKPVE